MKIPVTRTHGGMPTWCVLGFSIQNGKPLLFWPYKSDIGEKRFLTRFIVLRTGLISVDITRIHMDDGDRSDPHDHSRSFVSWKFGRYFEWVYDDPNNLESRVMRQHRRFSMHLMPYNKAHSITWVSPNLWTIAILGLRKQGSSYWTPNGKCSTGMKIDQEEWA